MSSAGLGLVVLVLVLVLEPGCATTSPASPRVETFRVNEAESTFTLTIEDPPAAPVEIRGDAYGSPLKITGPMARPAARREMLRYFETHVERLDGVKEAAADVEWMRTFREAYGR